jgi:hypothetical protein
MEGGFQRMDGAKDLNPSLYASLDAFGPEGGGCLPMSWYGLLRRTTAPVNDRPGACFSASMCPSHGGHAGANPIQPDRTKNMATQLSIPFPPDPRRRSRGTFRALLAGLLIVIVPLTARAALSTTSPATTTVTVGSNATFTVSASGGSPYSYQWQISFDNATYVPVDNYIWQNPLTQDLATLTLPNVTMFLDNAYIRCVVGNSVGLVVSGAARLYINTPASTKTIYINNDPGGVYESGTYSDMQPVFHHPIRTGTTPTTQTFSLSYGGGTGTAGATITWYKTTTNTAAQAPATPWAAISNGVQSNGTTIYTISADGFTLMVSNPGSTDNANYFEAYIVDNGTTTYHEVTNPAKLDVGDPLFGNSDGTGNGTYNGSQSAHAAAASTLTFQVNAIAGSAVSYQWQYIPYFGSPAGWTNVVNTAGLYSGATTNALGVKVTSVPTQNQSMFRCVITDSNGSIQSDPMLLTVW